MGKLRTWVCMVCCLLAWGCDPVRTTSQRVRLRIVDSASEQPIAGAKVSLRNELLADVSAPTEDLQFISPEDLDEQRHRSTLSQSAWHTGTTDRFGEVDIHVVITALDRTRGNEPPKWRDFVTGRPCLVRVEADRLPEEELRLRCMQPGASAQGRAYRVTVISVEKPRYVESK